MVIAVGQNDCNAGTSIGSMETAMRRMIQIVLDAGKIPVVPTLRWTYTNGATTVANIEAWNARLVTIRADYPACITGPDVYTRAKAQGLSGLRSDRTHLNDAGVALTQEDWDLWAMATMY